MKQSDIHQIILLLNSAKLIALKIEEEMNPPYLVSPIIENVIRDLRKLRSKFV